MNRAQWVVANVQYVPPRQAKKLRGILRYVQYRDNRDGHIPQESGLERWIDKGLGNNHQSIAAQCEAWQSAHVRAFTLVVNPNPQLIAFVPEDQREAFVQALTEATVENFFEARGLEPVEYAYVLHHRATKAGEMDNPHTHVFFPGTYESWADGERLPLYMNNSKGDNHIQLLHEIAETEMDTLMQRYVGLEWQQLCMPDVTAQTPELEISAPLTSFTNKKGETWAVYLGRQQESDTDKHNIFYIFENLDGKQQEAALANQLSAQQATQLIDYLIPLIQADPNLGGRLATEYAQQIDAADPIERDWLLLTPPNLEQLRQTYRQETLPTMQADLPDEDENTWDLSL